MMRLEVEIKTLIVFNSITSKTGIQYNLFACKQINKIKWISEDFIFIVIVEQHLFRSRKTPENRLRVFIFHVRKLWWEEKQIYS